MPVKRRTVVGGIASGAMAGGLPLGLSPSLSAASGSDPYGDLASGLAPEKDLVLFEKPEHPEMREGISLWMYEENGNFGFPRMGIEVVADKWGSNRFSCNFALGEGRVLSGAGYGDAPSPIDDGGKPTVIGGGPVTFQCLEPFRRWKVTYDGPAFDGNVNEQIDGSFYGQQRMTPVRMEAEMTMVTPAWVQEYSGDIENMSAVEAENAQAMGLGYRYEHHFRARGTLDIDGQRRDFSATGLRIHRQSIRRLEGFYGHCWLSALFPDDSAFGLLVYPPLAGESEYSYNDAVIYKHGRMYPARVISAPLPTAVIAEGEILDIELESELGRSRIRGETLLSTFQVGHEELQGLNLQQAGALYSWDGQQAYGMVERSFHPERVNQR